MQKIKIMTVAFVLLLSTIPKQTTAIGCKDLQIVFIRGSGGEAYTNTDYIEFKNTIESKIKDLNLSYDFIDLDYPAISVGLDNINVALGAYIGRGEAYEFGESVDIGVKNLLELVNSNVCNTKYILGGYSQGAIVISKSLNQLDSSKIIYAATFGDPKLYLPEGEGEFPVACAGKNLSNYRVYVPECHAYEGLLGGYKPYQPENFINKLGTWCNKSDIMCSGKLNISDHVHYISDSLYEDASRVIYNKIINYFNLERTYIAEHNTAIVIDLSTPELLSQFKNEALEISEEALSNNGAIALYGFKSLKDSNPLIKLCDFETCNMANIKYEIENLTTPPSLDTKSSLLSASIKVMKELNWKYGAIKSAIFLTDNDFYSPDLDGTTFDKVFKLSKMIDPVNFYIKTNNVLNENYLTLAKGTEGKVMLINDSNYLTNSILQRTYSLNRVEREVTAKTKPQIREIKTKIMENGNLQISIISDVKQILVSLNDKILGYTTEKTFYLKNIDFSKENKIRLVPIQNNSLGIGSEILAPYIPKIPDTSTTKILDNISIL